jgi:hypothetical protein
LGICAADVDQHGPPPAIDARLFVQLDKGVRPISQYKPLSPGSGFYVQGSTVSPMAVQVSDLKT